MAQNSKIEWTHHTANLWWGCTEVHEGCDNCYARVLDNRWNGNHWGKDSARRVINSVWKDLNKYQKLAKEAGQLHRVFVGSMMDIFEKPVEVVDIKGNPFTMNPDDGGMPDLQIMTSILRDRLFKQISDGLYPNLIFLLLTKRPSNINRFIPTAWKTNPPVNVMFGTSIVNQKTADKLVEELLEVNGRHFISMEPQLDFVILQQRWLDVPRYNELYPKGQIDWIIVGGESGHGKRPFNPDWARQTMHDCLANKVPFFMKQIDKIQPIPEDLMIRQFPLYHLSQTIN